MAYDIATVGHMMGRPELIVKIFLQVNLRPLPKSIGD